MKLIYCSNCNDVVCLTTFNVRSCHCGQCQGVYLDGRNAIYAGPCLPLGIDNEDLARLADSQSTAFQGFRIPANSRYFRRVDDALQRVRGDVGKFRRMGNQNIEIGSKP